MKIKTKIGELHNKIPDCELIETDKTKKANRWIKVGDFKISNQMCTLGLIGNMSIKIWAIKIWWTNISLSVCVYIYTEYEKLRDDGIDGLGYD